MNQTNKELLQEVIENQLRIISSLEAGSDTKAKEVECLTKCIKAHAEIVESEARCEEIRERIVLEKEKHLLEARSRDDERNYKTSQRSDAKFDMWANYGVQIGVLLVKLTAYTLWQERGYVFEETQSQRSPWLRNLTSNMGQIFR